MLSELFYFIIKTTHELNTSIPIYGWQKNVFFDIKKTCVKSCSLCGNWGHQTPQVRERLCRETAESRQLRSGENADQ